MSLLADALGMNELEVKAQEEHVGPFRADILCVDSGTDKLVLIENQLEKTDHNHLLHLLSSHRYIDFLLNLDFLSDNPGHFLNNLSKISTGSSAD